MCINVVLRCALFFDDFLKQDGLLEGYEFVIETTFTQSLLFESIILWTIRQLAICSSCLRVVAR